LGKRTNDILILLDEIEVENKICHGDLHLGNVMAYKDNYKVIDWMNVTSSSPMADVYRTVLMLESPVSYHTVPKEIRHLVKEVLNRVKESYLDYYFTNSEEGIESMRQWIPIVAASRLSEEVPFEKEWLISLIDKNLSC
jgi:thiamine kinase-like enzyme